MFCPQSFASGSLLAVRAVVAAAAAAIRGRSVWVLTRPRMELDRGPGHPPADMEKESGFTIERFESEDEFAFFAGGHADVVSTGSYETPVLESENGVPTVTIGKYNMAKASSS